MSKAKLKWNHHLCGFGKDPNISFKSSSPVGQTTGPQLTYHSVDTISHHLTAGSAAGGLKDHRIVTIPPNHEIEKPTLKRSTAGL